MSATPVRDALIGDVPARSTVALERDAQDTASTYVIDLVDPEEIRPPLDAPQGAFLSRTTAQLPTTRTTTLVQRNTILGPEETRDTSLTSWSGDARRFGPGRSRPPRPLDSASRFTDPG